MPTFDETIPFSRASWASQLVNLRAQEYDHDGVAIGSVITAGFAEYGSEGNFTLRKEFTITDGEQHTVGIYLVGFEDDNLISVVSPPAEGGGASRSVRVKTSSVRVTT
jgi:hypothetical protein